MTQKMIFKSAVRAVLLVCGVQAGPAFATYFIAQLVPPPAPSLGASPGPSPMVVPPKVVAQPPGLYVSVMDGQITVSNGGGASTFSPGQFGYTSSFSAPPVILPTNPGMPFSPPPTFQSSNMPGAAPSASPSGSVDCVVR